MKLKFKHQAFQSDAVSAVVDLFAGQDRRQSTFSVDRDAQMSILQNDFGFGNALLIDKETLRDNMHAVQRGRSMRTLTGEYLRSVQEAQIANFLYLNGLDWPQCSSSLSGG